MATDKGGIHITLSGADAILAATELRGWADVVFKMACHCRPGARFHEDSCLGVSLTSDISRIALNIETQVMRKARWRARKEK